MRVYESTYAPIKSWCMNPEEGALNQAKDLARLPFVFKHVALMPDTHQGYGMPIGGVLATKGVVVPNAVGVDIGCGMCAVRTELNEVGRDTLKKWMGMIREVVPVGFNHHQKQQSVEDMPLFKSGLEIVNSEMNKALFQVGTLGGGNHFIEIQKGSDGFVWVMIHSGSRNLGKTVADVYNKIAKEENERWYSDVPREWDLAFLPLNSEAGQAYLAEMDYCVEFALANRSLMMARILEIMGCSHDPMINIAHNYARMENHFGSNVMVHRKGATLASVGTVGIIPGSQGTKSYIVRGKGNPDSFTSCSHGAGRKLGRKEASRTLSLEGEIRALEERGVIHSVRNTKDLDEAPGAYKDIDVVMEEQKDLVETTVELTPLAVIKG